MKFYYCRMQMIVNCFRKSCYNRCDQLTERTKEAMEQNLTGSSDKATREYLDSLFVEMRHLDARKPDTSFHLYGERFDTPVMIAASSHATNLTDGEMVKIAKGAKMAGAVNFAGMGDKEELEDIIQTGARTIKIIKPYADNNMISDRIAHAEKCGAFAVGIDIEHVFNSSGEHDTVMGYEMCPKTLEEMKEFVNMTSLPFIVKGVLSVRDAYKCLKAGVKGIVVSHHHGIMEGIVSPLKVLPSIVKVIGGEIPVFLDCEMLSGMDVFKALSLGADGVCVDRVIMEPFREKGAEGVKDAILKITDELRGVMAGTGCYDLSHMDSSVIWK